MPDFQGTGLEGIVAIILGTTFIFGTPIMIVVAILVYKLRRAHQPHETIRILAEKGLPIPPELFVEKPEQQEKSPLRSGVTLIAVGVGLIAFFLARGDHANWGIGLIPLLMGLGYLIVWKLERRDGK